MTPKAVISPKQLPNLIVPMVLSKSASNETSTGVETLTSRKLVMTTSDEISNGLILKVLKDALAGCPVEAKVRDL